MYATGNIIIPLKPESGYDSGLSNTIERLVMAAREYFALDILAVVPTALDSRIDQQTRDRGLLQKLNSLGNADTLVPPFARLTEEDWEAIDAHEYDGPLPGIRFRGAIDAAHQAGQPLRDYDPTCDRNRALRHARPDCGGWGDPLMAFDDLDDAVSDQRNEDTEQPETTEKEESPTEQPTATTKEQTDPLTEPAFEFSESRQIQFYPVSARTRRSKTHSTSR